MEVMEAQQKLIEAAQLLQLPQPDAESDLLTSLERLKFNSVNEVKPPEPILTIDGHTISTGGYITTFVGQSKAGKSGLISSMIGGAMAVNSFYDSCGEYIKPNNEGKLLIHIDTEQNEYNHHKSISTALKRANLTREPEWLASYRLATLTPSELQIALKSLLSKYAPKFNGVHSIFIDGGADFVNSVNKEEECNAVVREFEAIAREHNCPIFCIIHLNPGADSTKGRGHFDSQLQRKSEAYLKVTKDKESEISKIEPLLLRNAGGVPEIQFCFDRDKGYHISAGKAQTKSEQKHEAYSNLALSIFGEDNNVLTYSELIEKVKAFKGVKDRAAEYAVRDMTTAKVITTGIGSGKSGYIRSLNNLPQ
jgi:hypothetical protein